MSTDWLIKYTNPLGVQYTLTDGVHSFLEENGLHGFGVLQMSLASTRRPYTDGTIRLGRPYTPERMMSIALWMTHDSYADLIAFNREMARNVNPYLDPDTLGSLNMEGPGGTLRDIDCQMVEWPDMEFNGPVQGRVIPSFWAPGSRFYDPTLVSEDLSLPGDDGFSIPLSVPVSLAATAIDGYIYINNDGDVDAWPVVRISGPCDDPTLTNDTTGQAIAITQSQDVDDYIEIDMLNATVNWWDNSAAALTNIIENISTTSQFWPLRRGDNAIHVEATGATGGTISVSYYKQYQSL